MKRKLLMCIMWITFFSILLSTVYAASTTPSLVTKINSAFTRMQSYLQKLSTPIAGFCIITGILIRKLSLGDERKMILGRRIIVNSVVGYAAIRLIDLILKFIEAVVK